MAHVQPESIVAKDNKNKVVSAISSARLHF